MNIHAFVDREIEAREAILALAHEMKNPDPETTLTCVGVALAEYGERLEKLITQKI